MFLSFALHKEVEELPPHIDWYLFFQVRQLRGARRSPTFLVSFTASMFLSFALHKEVEKLLPHIDWNPFFQVWQLRGVCR